MVRGATISEWLRCCLQDEYHRRASRPLSCSFMSHFSHMEVCCSQWKSCCYFSGFVVEIYNSPPSWCSSLLQLRLVPPDDWAASLFIVDILSGYNCAWSTDTVHVVNICLALTIVFALHCTVTMNLCNFCSLFRNRSVDVQCLFSIVIRHLYYLNEQMSTVWWLFMYVWNETTVRCL